jgi:hypothetical protein
MKVEGHGLLWPAINPTMPAFIRDFNNFVDEHILLISAFLILLRVDRVTG